MNIKLLLNIDMCGLVKSIEKEGKLYLHSTGLALLPEFGWLILKLKRNSAKDMTNDLLRDEPDNGHIYLT